MKHSLRSQRIFQYMVIVIVCMLVIPTAISNLLEWQFKNFLDERLDEYETEFSAYLASAYAEYGSWRGRGILPRGSNFLRWPVAMVQITDPDGGVVRVYRRFAVKTPPMHGAGHHRGGMRQAEIEGLMVRHKEIVVEGVTVGKVSFFVLPFDKSPENKFCSSSIKSCITPSPSC